MSHEATGWVLALPNDAFPTAPDALRWTLFHMADVAGVDNGHMFYMSRRNLALKRQVSEDTIKRHLKLLEDAGLIEPGNEALVSRFAKNMRPRVWHVPVGRTFGGAPMTPQPVDNSESRGGTHAPPSDLGGASIHGSGGHACTPNQVLNQRDNSPTHSSTDETWEFSTGYEGAPFTNDPLDDTYGECVHGFAIGIHPRRDGVGVEPWCPLCRKAKTIIPATKEHTNA
jgi:hypothetical protein